RTTLGCRRDAARPSLWLSSAILRHFAEPGYARPVRLLTRFALLALLGCAPKTAGEAEAKRDVAWLAAHPTRDSIAALGRPADKGTRGRGARPPGGQGSARPRRAREPRRPGRQRPHRGLDGRHAEGALGDDPPQGR